jgi:hypothetical protein
MEGEMQAFASVETTGFIQAWDEPRPAKTLGNWPDVWAKVETQTMSNETLIEGDSGLIGDDGTSS